MDRSLAGIAAVSCVELTYVVGRSAPFQVTTDVVTKCNPFTTRSKEGSPTATEFGDNKADIGAGLSTVRLRSRFCDLGGRSWSITLAVNEKVPALVGVPAITPAVVRLIPSGRFPKIIDH